MNNKQNLNPKGQLLKDVYPNLFKDWDDKLNIGRDKYKITIGSSKFNVKWSCHKCGYKWEQKVINRVKHQTGCLICSNQHKLLSVVSPKIFEEFDIENNYGIDPKLLFIGSGKKINWKCKVCGNQWGQNIDIRVNLGTKCKLCSSKENLFVNTHPELLKEWDYDKNIGINPKILLNGSNVKVWWKCKKCGNSFQTDIYNRTTRNSKCGKCRVRTKTMLPFLDIYPKLLKELDNKKNIDISKIKKLTTGSNVVLWWKCKKGHSFQCQVYERIQKNNCPYCRGLKVDETNSLQSLRPDLNKEWDFGLNTSINPNEVPVSSNLEVHWKCIKGHKWVSSIVNRTKNKGTTCPVCSGRKSVNETSFGYLYPLLLKEWDYENNEIDPFNIRSGSQKKVSWKCIKGHSWETKLNTRVRLNVGCPFCYGRYTTLERSIGYLKPKFMDEWDEVKNEEFDPYKISSGSDIKVWWKCQNDINHYWKTSISNRNNGSGCPYCSGTELLVKRYVNRYKSKLSDEIQLYYLIFFNKNECFYKIGITKNSIEERYRTLYDQTGYKILKYKIITDKLKYVINIEQTTHKMVSRNLDKNLIHYKPKKYFGGIGECYNLPIELTKYIDLLKSKYKYVNKFIELKDLT